ncbi:MAG TPA: ACT domain-containing protein [Caldithrix abyssi]|uniref:ACT domain-containing protein n=1 Tax=Caldithrix abyssi TaxID=187145 RepID=A0A7V1PV70_CALAY|nr:ACT domain-containing protein [Caldithrix abyssi]
MSQLNESEIRRIAELAVRQLQGQATPANVEKVVREAISRMAPKGEASSAVNPERMKNVPFSAPAKGARIILTAFGTNSIGILAGLTAELAALKCDIVDLSQKIMQDFFTIMILVDSSNSDVPYEEIRERMARVGETFNLKVIVQHEDIFKTMHRV